MPVIKHEGKDGRSGPRRRQPLLERIMEGFTPVPFSGCWIWDRNLSSDGYAVLRLANGRRGGGRNVRVHRLLYELVNDCVIPPELDACHKCDVKPCINPQHIYPGTRLDNVTDARVRGRLAIGERVGGAKLTEAIVREIRNSVLSGRALAVAHGVSPSLITMIRRRQIWRHI